ncbi:MAG: hypothetical protein KKF48_02880 [Nanoarchaeota archaeon]|nr:hypothetical protein [Nanoarchaeota archaeon]MBU1027967.1 hypothetical protein [Nanoarchaeota archaeon]
MNKQIYNQIIKKKELSKLPKKDVEMAFVKFEKREVSDKEKIRLTRDLLNKVYWPFRSTKLLSIKEKPVEWILRKHLGTRERIDFYEKLYRKLLKGFDEVNVIDLGCGANGFSYNYFPCKVNYFGAEAVGQLVDNTNNYFKKSKIKGRVSHLSLFEMGKVKKIIKKIKGKKIVFLFKVLDSLEMLERDYSKRLLKEIVLLVDKVVVSFATKSMVKKEKFKVKRKWVLNFIRQNFKLLDDFELGTERYFVFGK